MAAASTMLRMVKRLIALSLGTHREQLVQRTGLTWPRPFLLRPLWKRSNLLEHLNGDDMGFRKRQGRGQRERNGTGCWPGNYRGDGGCAIGIRENVGTYLDALFLTILTNLLRGLATKFEDLGCDTRTERGGKVSYRDV